MHSSRNTNLTKSLIQIKLSRNIYIYDKSITKPIEYIQLVAFFRSTSEEEKKLVEYTNRLSAMLFNSILGRL